MARKNLEPRDETLPEMRQETGPQVVMTLIIFNMNGVMGYGTRR